MQSEAELISRILEGDLDAFRLLLRQYEKLVALVVSRMVKGREDQEDARQEVFIRVYRKLHTFRGESKLSTWITKVAYNTALNYLQSTAGKKALITDINEAEKLFMMEAGPDTLLMQKDSAAYIQSLIDRLPLPYRTVLTLYHIGELTYQEIEAITGMPEGTVCNVVSL